MVEGKKTTMRDFEASAIVVASSTGGPDALEILLKGVGSVPSVPIFIAQHMPAPFTQFLASRLESTTKLVCREAQHGETVQAGKVYIAPANYHMRLERTKSVPRIVLDQSERLHGVRPSADYLFETASICYPKHLLAFVLTGMGEDGCKGARLVKQSGGIVIIQDRKTSVVWGMPGAVHTSGFYDVVASIEKCAELMKRLSRPRGSAS